MDSQSMQQATQNAVKKRFGGKQFLESRIVTHYPQNLERDYVRAVNAHMKLFSNVLAEYIPRIRAVLAQGEHGKTRAKALRFIVLY